MKYLPQAIIYRDNPPEASGFTHSLMSDDIVKQTESRPGARTNLQWMVLDPTTMIAEAGMPGYPSTFSNYHPPAIILNHTIAWKSHGSGFWMYEPSAAEQDWRTIQLDKYQDALNALQQQDTMSPDDEEKALALEQLIKQLGYKGAGYLEFADNLLNSRNTGIAWGLGVANIPVTVTSTFYTQRNRSQSFRLKRLAATEGQVNHTFTIEIGDGNTLFALVIGDDGNSSDFIHYRPMSKSARKDLQTQLDAKLDTGRLTVDDYGQIEIWEHEIALIRYQASETSESPLSEEHAAQIKIYQNMIKERKDSKRGVLDAVQEEISALEKQLYYFKEKFSLQESTKVLLDRSVDFSIIFLRSGYIVIQSEDNRKCFRIDRLPNMRSGKRIKENTVEELPTYFDILPPNSYITLKSTGGYWALVYGNPLFDSQGTFWTQEFYLSGRSPSDAQWIIEHDSSSPGCTIAAQVVSTQQTVENDGVKSPGKHQIRVDFYSNNAVTGEYVGAYTPELYYLELHIPAKPVSGRLVTLWDSENPRTFWSDNKTSLIDIQIQDAENRSRLSTLFIANGRENAKLPLSSIGAACDISLYDPETGRTIPVVTHGFVSGVDRGDHEAFGLFGNGHLTMAGATGDQVRLEVLGCEGFLDLEIPCLITGNGVYVGDYFRLLLQDIGLPESLYASLPIGDSNGCPQIPRTHPGHLPDVRPAEGTRLWDWMKEIVRKHAHYWEIWSDETGIKLTRKFQRKRTDVWFSSSVSPDSHRALRRESTEGGGLTPTQEIRDYFTYAIFIGAIDPETGMRFVGAARIPQATDPKFKNSSFYTGIERSYTGQADDSLRSEQECIQAARDFLNITSLTPQGYTPWSLRWKADLDLSVRAGDLLQVNDLWFVIESTEFAALNSTNTGQQMVLRGRLVEDLVIENA